MISFIIPLNERKLDRLDGLLYNIERYYGKPSENNYEVIIINQNINESFKLGQNRNVGFQKSIGDIIVFLDVDIRFKNKLNFEEILLKSKNRPVVCWEFIIQINEDENYNITELSEKQKGVGKGGCIAFKREQYIKSCGHSNLIFGWGKEDDILAYRSNLIRLTGVEIYHFYHKDKRQWGLDKEKMKKALSMNVDLVNMVRDGKIDSEKDGFMQTVASFDSIKKYNNKYIRFFNVSNVGVSYEYEYLELYYRIMV